jgi:hypothetical protein
MAGMAAAAEAVADEAAWAVTGAGVSVAAEKRGTLGLPRGLVVMRCHGGGGGGEYSLGGGMSLESKRVKRASSMAGE